MTEHQIPVVFDVTAADRRDAARAVEVALSARGLSGALRLNREDVRIESWWLAPGDLKDIDGNDNPNLHLTPEPTIGATAVVLAQRAWKARDNARILGRTAVGCAVLGRSDIYTGCNVEHSFRSHDMHAETNAIGTMIAAGDQHLQAVVIVAVRDRFSPCGACLDWIFEFGGPTCTVAWQTSPEAPIQAWTARDLMPHFPR